eukprot:TRINITY_DN12717_c1_g1_i1.p1 TRINITY_DN12717_c1_g1~~TRINITY_DN12717_c1_g1_i1.p1  ORF type:complete len:1877 (-),score=641.20 TRINITY_DN12717_c1_g1_i1:7532-13162(-)
MRASSSGMPKGLTRQSSAPASSASTFSDSCVRADRITMGTLLQLRISVMTCLPSPSGRPRSRMIRSGLRVPASVTPSRAVLASWTMKPSCSSALLTSLRICGSSSMKTMLPACSCMMCPYSSGRAGCVSTGSVKQTVAPCPASCGAIQILPWCASMMARQIASPRPTPGVVDSLSPRVNFSKACCAMAGGKPRPWSLTQTLTWVVPSLASTWAEMAMPLPGGEYLMAFSTRLASTRSSSTASTRNSGRSDAMRVSTWRPSSALESSLSADPVNSSRAFHWRFRVTTPACRRAMSSRLFIRPTIFCDCSLMVRAMARASSSSRALAASTSALPTSEVSGVRRSCEMADKSELRKRSDSIVTSASWATSAQCRRSMAMAICEQKISSIWRFSGRANCAAASWRSTSLGASMAKASTPRVRMVAVSGRYSAAAEGNVAVPLPAAWPLSQTHWATPASTLFRTWALPLSCSGSAWRNWSALSGRKKAMRAPNTAARWRRPISRIWSSVSKADNSLPSMYRLAARASRCMATLAWRRKREVSELMNNDTASITARVSRYCASDTVMEKRGSTKKKSKDSTDSTDTSAEAERPQRIATSITPTRQSMMTLAGCSLPSSTKARPVVAAQLASAHSVPRVRRRRVSSASAALAALSAARSSLMRAERLRATVQRSISSPEPAMRWASVPRGQRHRRRKPPICWPITSLPALRLRANCSSAADSSSPLMLAVSAPSDCASFRQPTTRSRADMAWRSRGRSTWTASHSACSLAARRAASRISRSSPAPLPTATTMRSRACHNWAMERSARYCRMSASTRSAVRRRAISRRAIRLPLRKKLRPAFSACCGRQTLPSFRRVSSSSGGMSTSLTSSASSKTWSGTVSKTRMPVIWPTTSLRLSMCCTLRVVQTSMPARSSSSISCQRLAWREPGTLECASSSTRITPGLRSSAASRSNSGNWRLRQATMRMGMRAMPASCASVSTRPWVSTTPATTSVPWAASAWAASSMAKVLPTPAEKPKKIFRRPRAWRSSSRITRSSRSSGSGRVFMGRVSVMRHCSGKKPAARDQRATGQAWEGRDLLALGLRGQGSGHIQGQVQLEHIDARLAEQAPLRGFAVAPDQGPDLVHAHTALTGHAGRLVVSGVRADVRIETTGRGRQQVDGNGALVAGVGLLQGLGTILGGLLQGRVGRAQVAAAGGHAVIGEGPGGRRTAPEIGRAGEVLADQFGTDQLALAFDQAAIGLLGEEALGQAGHRQRIQPAQQYPQQDEQRQRRAQRVGSRGFHDAILAQEVQTRPKAASNMSISLMPTKGTSRPPRPQISRLRRSSTAAPSARQRTPRRASGIRATITSALKITADMMAELGLARRITSSAPSCGQLAANIAGMMAKYLATSLAILKVVRLPRVISICLPISTISISLVGLESRSTMLPASLAAWVPLFMATATSAWASAGASLVPSPVIATSLPSAWCWRIRASFCSGVASARKSSTPASAAIAAAVRRLSPVIMMVLMPMRRSSPKRSLMPPLTMSFNSTVPRMRSGAPLLMTAASACHSMTTRGVPPRRAMASISFSTWDGRRWSAERTSLRMASADPLRMRRLARSMPETRVCAENGMNSAPRPAISRSRRLKRFLASTTMLRPSGVSSASEASWATSASSRSDTPGAGRKDAAWRLPRVMVPVLSSNSTSTSPAASTARPEVAITLACIMRLMPATPMAESRPPMVVGIRHTSSAIKAVTDTGAPAPAAVTENSENGSSVTVTSRNTSVNATSSSVRASSLGVFWRRAPSTMAIMRSRKASPGFTETRTTIQSDSTRVPPVTAEKSPPDSRITGADSPVMALSSTVATPSMTSPSAGTVSPASMNTRSPLRRLPPSTISHWLAEMLMPSPRT